LNIPEKVKYFLSIHTKETYEINVDLPISLNLFLNFSTQASTVVVSNFHEYYSNFHLFRLLATFNISEIWTPVCHIDAVILVSLVVQDAIFTTRTSRGSLT